MGRFKIGQPRAVSSPTAKKRTLPDGSWAKPGPGEVTASMRKKRQKEAELDTTKETETASAATSIQQYGSEDEEDSIEEEVQTFENAQPSLGKGFLIDTSTTGESCTSPEFVRIGIVCHASPAAINSDCPFIPSPAEKLQIFLNSSLTMAELKKKRTQGGLWRESEGRPVSPTFLFMVLHQRVTMRRAQYIASVLNLFFRKSKRADMSQSLGDILREMDKEFEFFQEYTTSVSPKSSSSPAEFLGHMGSDDDLDSLQFKEFSEMEEMAWKIMNEETLSQEEEELPSQTQELPSQTEELPSQTQDLPIVEQGNMTLTTATTDCSSIRIPDPVSGPSSLGRRTVTADLSELSDSEALQVLVEKRLQPQETPPETENLTKSSLTGHWTHPSLATQAEKLDGLYELFYYHADEIVKAGQRCNVAVARCKKVIRENTEVVRNSAQSVKGDLKEFHGKTELKLECVKSAVNNLVHLQQDGADGNGGKQMTKDFVGSFMKEAVLCGKRNLEEKGKGRRHRWLQSMKINKMFPKPALRFPVKDRQQLEQVCASSELRGYYVQLVDMTNCKTPISGVRECCRTILGKYSPLSLSLSFRK